MDWLRNLSTQKKISLLYYKEISQIKKGLIHDKIILNKKLKEKIFQKISKKSVLIAQAIKTAESEQRKPRVEVLREKVEDSSFLNALQNLVSKWIREIQKMELKKNGALKHKKVINV